MKVWNTTRRASWKADKQCATPSLLDWNLPLAKLALAYTILSMAPDAADERTRYEAAKKELSQALKKKRDLDKQLVSSG